ncbi:hypothetical protein Syun_019525 [Stephania yunnanensis]|uniref:Uncharacterized protein n=1 Tax=Stephania yunnanensis TaxID=152371 RepID=A0AAP0IVZ1_9MAGN
MLIIPMPNVDHPNALELAHGHAPFSEYPLSKAEMFLPREKLCLYVVHHPPINISSRNPQFLHYLPRSNHYRQSSLLSISLNPINL